MKNLLLILSILVLLTTSAVAQSTFGTIAGSVVDASGAAVADAQVTATSLETNDTRTAISSKVGGYRIESLLPGFYRVDVTAPTFAKETVNGVAVDPSVITSVNVKLSVGSATTN